MVTPGMQSLRASREATVKAHIEAEGVNHSVAGVVASFAHPRYEVPALGAVADGAEAVTGLVTQLLAAFPDLDVTQHTLHHADAAVILEITFGGTHSGPWAGLGPTGRRMEVPAVCVFDFDGPDLICEKVYFDHATILRALGAEA